jgi:hypothetical protein
VAVLKAQLDLLEQEVRRQDYQKLREELAALAARVDMIANGRDPTARKLNQLAFLVFRVLAVSVANRLSSVR